MKSKFISTGVRLSLLFDWICYNPSAESIMNIEPALLLLERNIEKHSYISNWVLEYLSELINVIHPSYKDLFLKRASLAINDSVEKGVIKGLNHIVNSAHLTSECKAFLLTITGQNSVSSFEELEDMINNDSFQEDSIIQDESMEINHDKVEQISEVNVADDRLWMFGEKLVDLQNSIDHPETFVSIMTGVINTLFSVDEIPIETLGSVLSVLFSTAQETNPEYDFYATCLFSLLLNDWNEESHKLKLLRLLVCVARAQGEYEDISLKLLMFCVE
jgi:hypothetical protein